MLPTSQHIGKIVIDPRDANVVYVAAVGPLWAPGGERGLFKTTDGGKTWTNLKEISKYTGFTEIAMDPSNPDVLYAASLERERREYGFLPGGPETGIFKTTDAGRTWNEAHRRSPRRRPRPHWFERLQIEAGDRLRDDPRQAAGGGTLPQRGRRRDVEADERPGRHGVVLQPGALRPDESGSRHSAQRAIARVEGRRQDAHALRGGRRAQRPSRPLDQRRRPGPHDPRRRRRRVHDVRRRPHVGPQREHRRRTVLRHRRGRRAAVLQRVRRLAGQSDVGRSEPNAQQLRPDERRLVPHGRRRRLLRRSRSARQQPRVRRIADGRRRALRRAHRSDEEHPSRAQARRAIPLQLERADPAEQARREERVHGGAIRLQEHRPRRLVGEDQPRPHTRHRSQQAADARQRPRFDGARPQRRHGGVQQHLDDRSVAAQEGFARRRH